MTRTVVHFIESREFGGTEQALLHLLSGLDRERWRPVLVHHPGPGIAPLLDGARRLGVALQAVPDMRSATTVARVPELVRVLRRLRPALFHAHLSWPLACRFGLIAASLAPVPAVVGTVQLFMHPARSRFGGLQHRILTASVDRYIAVSGAVAERLYAVGVPRGKVRVVRNAAASSVGGAADPALRSAFAGRTHRPVVLTAARLDPQKGHAVLLEAATLVPDAVFVLAGDGSERGALEARAWSLGVADRVFFLGQRADVPALLASADLFVLPSFYEGLPLSVLEAMAAGTPVVASAVDGTVEAVTHEVTGLLVAPGDPAALAAAIRRVLGDPGLASRLAAAAQARVRAEFSVCAMVEGVTRVYDELVSLGRGARGHG